MCNAVFIFLNKTSGRKYIKTIALVSFQHLLRTLPVSYQNDLCDHLFYIQCPCLTCMAWLDGSWFFCVYTVYAHLYTSTDWLHTRPYIVLGDMIVVHIQKFIFSNIAEITGESWTALSGALSFDLAQTNKRWVLKLKIISMHWRWTRFHIAAHSHSHLNLAYRLLTMVCMVSTCTYNIKF